MYTDGILVIPDVHGCSHQDDHALDVFLTAAERLAQVYRITKVVQLGDLLDAGEFSSHPPSNIYEEVPSWEEELEWAVDFFWKHVRDAVPNADLHFIEGNHEYRAHRYFIGKMGRGKMSTGLYESYNACSIFEREGIKVTPYGGLNVMDSALILNDIVFIHGWSHAVNAAKAHLDRTLGSRDVIFGHVHRMTHYMRRDPISNHNVGSWSFGALAKTQQFYNKATPNDHVLGFGLVLIDDTGRKTIYSIPIHVNGSQYFCTLPNGDRIIL